MSTQTPPASLVRLLHALHELGASDLFLTEGQRPSVRLHGRVVPLQEPPTEVSELDDLVRAVLVGPRYARFVMEGDADAGLSTEDGRRYRLNLSRQRDRRMVVARAVPSGALELSALGLPPAIARLADRPRGLVLVTGATGSGKSTTLAAMVHHINGSRDGHIVTVEDPIEFVHSDLRCRVTQREVGQDTGSFTAALRHVVRQSPDVILIGELRDAETIQVAIQASLTGHLVLASLHTIDASQTLHRILSYFPEHSRNQIAVDLSLSLQGIFSQRLIPRRDGNGRALAAELLTMTPAAQRLLREQRVDELGDLMRSFRSPDMMSFNDSLFTLLRAGVVDYDLAIAASTWPDELALLAKGMVVGTDAFRSPDVESTTGFDMKGLLRHAIEKGASDLHLTVGRPPMIRLSGTVSPIGVRPLTDADLRILLFSILTARQRSVYELEREIDFALSLDEGRRFRVNAYFQKGHMAASLRAIPSKVPDAVELRVPEVVLSVANKPQGLLLVVGPTGSGKSTTLACLVDRINPTRACRIITIEDPREYVHEGIVASVDQREVYADTKSFAAALKYILRQDPDVILVGEMRDLETISNALTAAETGHLVLATLHSNDALQAIDRVIDVFPAHQQGQVRSQLANALVGVVSQRLIPRKDGRGRVPVFETMMATSAIRALIREDKMHQARSIMETSRRDGMMTMDYALNEVYEAGLIHYDDAIAYAANPKSFRMPVAVPPPAPEPPAAPPAPARTALAPPPGATNGGPRSR